MFGTALGRISRPLLWESDGSDVWWAIDGNGNNAGRVNRLGKKQYHAEYTTASIRLVSGPKAPFLNLGVYYSLGDAQRMVEFHEECKTIPIFKPGKIIGWVDKEKTIQLCLRENRISIFRLLLFRFFRMIWAMIRRVISGKE